MLSSEMIIGGIPYECIIDRKRGDHSYAPIIVSCSPRDPEVYALMEENKIVHLIDVKASSFDFVIKKAIEELGGQL